LLFVLINSFGDILLEGSKRFFGDFLSAKIVSDKVLDEFGDVFVAFSEVFVELVGDHLSELLPLLDCLGFFDG
jgi:hypothetical protein